MALQELNNQQRELLQQFAEAVRDCVAEKDTFFLRWLQASNFDVMEAEARLRQSFEWRRANKVDEILDWKPPEVLLNYLPIGMSGYDKFGGPVWINAYGRADSRGLFQSVSREDYFRYITYLAEQNFRHTEELQRINDSKNISTIVRETAIIDLEHLSMYQLSYKPVREVGIELTKMLQANYPDNLRRVFVINASKLFTMAFALIKPFFSQETLNKFAVYGSNKKEWQAALLKEIEADQLPVHYGGTMADPDGNPLCTSKICMGGQVPTHYYITSKKPFSGDAELLSIPARMRKTYEFDIRTINSIIRWEFFLEKGDVGFSIYRLDGDERIEVIPYQCSTNKESISQGDIVCTNISTYFVEFDNSYSYLRSKKLWVSISVQPDH